MSPEKPHVLCFGEVLWDCVPRGLFLGGAPANVAYHLTRLGCDASLITSVGSDFLGDEILRRMAGWGVDTRFVARIPEKQTGVVLVDLADPAHPSYDIVQDVAWDDIEGSPKLFEEAKRANGFVFGTLAARGKHNLDLLDLLLADSTGLKAFDINLRLPFVDRDLVFALARRSNLIKLNNTELAFLIPGNASLIDRAKELSRETNCDQICVTCGEEGAGLLIAGDWHWVGARPIKVKDAIGAGDAFLAALVAGLLYGSQSPGQLLTRAGRLAEFVAASDGATPAYEDGGTTFLPVHSA